MSKQEIEGLLEKYYAGETSLEEEKILFKHYKEENISSDNSGQAQFLYFNAKKNEEPLPAFSTKLDSFTFSEKRLRQINLVQILRIAALLTFCVGIAWFLIYRQANPATRKIITHSGEQTNTTLPDGSVVWLNGTSQLEFNETFGQDNREIFLKGEAYFEVIKDPNKPFVIHTGEVTTEVLGTSFNLRSYQPEQDIELNVISGVVRFGSRNKIEVVPGAAASFNSITENIQTHTANPNATAWKTKQLVFDNDVMRNVLRDIERYFHITFEVKNTDLLNCHFKGSFQDPELEAVLKIIGYSLNVEYSFRNGKYILQGQNCAQ